MMIDFAIEKERGDGTRTGRGDLSGLRDPFSPDHDDHHGGAGRHPACGDLGFGEGGETRVPLGMAVVGGLVVSQFLTLYLTPVIYLYMDRAVKTVQRWTGNERKPAEAIAAAGRWWPAAVSPLST